MQCALSGQVAEHPIVSIKSGHVFERRLLETYLREHEDQCPVTGEPLSEKDLVSLVIGSRTSTKNNDTKNMEKKDDAAAALPQGRCFAAAVPRPLDSTSIPSLLSYMQQEWDALMLTTHALQQQLQATRQELSQAYYTQDAACRVIARLLKEKESSTSFEKETPHSSADMDVEDEKKQKETNLSGVPVHIQTQISEKASQLSSTRKSSQSTCTKSLSELEDIQAVSSHTPHRSDKPGILCLDVHPVQPFSVTGGVDAAVKVFDREQKRVLGTLNGHEKKVNAVAFHPSTENGSLLFSASEDATVKVWRSEKRTKSSMKFNEGHTFTGHEGAVTDIAVHATGDLLGSSGVDGSWSLLDIREGICLSKSKSIDDASIQCFAFHPDGGICATGTSSKGIKIWDVNNVAELATFEGHDQGNVSDVSFSENGYHMASGGSDGLIYLWDLRKLKSFLTLDCNAKNGGPVHALTYESSGSILGVASGSVVQIWKQKGKKEWELAKSLTDHSASVTDVKIMPDVDYIASTSMDRSLKFYA